MGGGHNHEWTGWRARLFAATHRNPPSNLAVPGWAALEPGMRVLDVGCGTGAAVLVASPHVAQAVGVDPSPDFVRIARRRARGLDNVRFELGSAEQLPFEASCFDVVWSVHSAHHWHRLPQALSEIQRVMSPGGQVLLVERHAPDRPWGISEDAAARLAEALGDAGFADVRAERRTAGRASEFLISGFSLR